MAPLTLTRFHSAIHTTYFYIYVPPPTWCFALGVYIFIHSIGLSTNVALSGTLTLFAEMPLSRLRPIRLFSELMSIWLFAHNRIEQPVWHFGLDRDAVNRFGPYFDCLLLLNRIVGSSHRRDIFQTIIYFLIITTVMPHFRIALPPRKLTYMHICMLYKVDNGRK